MSKFLKSESERIALVRTIAPLVWSFILLRVADFGLELDEWLAGLDGEGGIDVGMANSAMTIVLGVVLWLLARFAPNVLERIVMWIPVEDYAYSKPDQTLIVPAGKIEGGAPVLAMQPHDVAASAQFTDAFIARQPSGVQLRAAAQRLLDAADSRS